MRQNSKRCKTGRFYQKRERRGASARSLHITGAACVGSFFLGVGKLALGLASLSLFTCVNAFYTFGMVAAKSVSLAGLAKESAPETQFRCYRAAGWMLTAASALYILYSVKLILHPVAVSYHKYAAISIASVTFLELGLNLRGVIVERRNHLPLVHAIKMLNLASSLICLVLTQAAILSFASEKAGQATPANGILGTAMGAAAAVLGVAMVLRERGMRKGKYAGVRKREEAK